jgi:hypothetical protein
MFALRAVRSLAVSSILAPLFAALVACGSASTTSSAGNDDTSIDDGTSATSGASRFCSTACERSKSCGDTGLDVSTCTLDCENNEASSFSRMRTDISGTVESCLEAASCEDVLSGTFFGDCVSDGLAEVAPTAAARSFCKAYEAAEESCGSSVDEASCLGFALPYADSFLEQASSCAAKSCSAIDPCVDAVLDLSSDGDDDGGT